MTAMRCFLNHSALCSPSGSTMRSRQVAVKAASSSPRQSSRRAANLALAAALAASFAVAPAAVASESASVDNTKADTRAGAITKTPEEWKAALGPDAYYVLREAGTERPFSSPLNNEKRPGTFTCAGCGQNLFDAGTKAGRAERRS